MMRDTALLAQATMANKLAHEIINPLQSLANILYLAADGHHGESSKIVGCQALGDLKRLSSVVKELLRLPQQKPC